MPMAVRMTLGDVRLGAEGKLTRDGAAEGRLQFAGERLDRLGKLLGVQLPEVGPYSVEGNLAASTGTIRATDVALSLGRSRAVGELQFEPRGTGRARSRTQLRLQVPSLHLEDLHAGRWIHGAGRDEAGGSTDAHTVRRGEAAIERGLDLLRNADIDATLEVEALHGAGERFASGRVHATNEAGEARVRLLNVRTAGGGLDADVSVESKEARRKVGVRLRVSDLDYGPLVRTVDPGSTMAGKLDLVVDLAAEGPPENLLPALAGTVDVAVYPRGLHSAALDFWGVGVLDTMLRALDPDSKSAVDCAVTSFDIDAGVAKSTAFFVDSTRVRVIGELEVNLTTRALTGRIRPKAVDPGLLKLAPTMVLGGTIDSVKVSVAPTNIVSAPLRFAASLAEFPRDWLGAKGSARAPVQDCREAFERTQKARAGVADALPR
jgi:uncharacterized protein involved in outer membrane biogenesis